MAGKARKKRKRSAVSAKIKHAMGEGMTQKRAVGMALGMQREGRLGPRGGYKRKGRKRKGY